MTKTRTKPTKSISRLVLALSTLSSTVLAQEEFLLKFFDLTSSTLTDNAKKKTGEAVKIEAFPKPNTYYFTTNHNKTLKIKAFSQEESRATNSLGRKPLGIAWTKHEIEEPKFFKTSSSSPDDRSRPVLVAVYNTGVYIKRFRKTWIKTDPLTMS